MINGCLIDLSHLIPIFRRVNLELRGNFKKEVDVLFEFSCHCYSRRILPEEVVPLDLLVVDGSSKMPRNRLFDQKRYSLSKHLVSLIDLIIEGNAKVTKTRHENFYRTELFQKQTSDFDICIRYFMFMSASVVIQPGRTKYLRVYIESAYPEQLGIPHPKGKGVLNFAAMLGEKWAQ